MEKPTEDTAFSHQSVPKRASPATGLRLASGRLCGGGSGHGKGTAVTAGWGCAMLQGSGIEVPAGLHVSSSPQTTRGWELGRKYLSATLYRLGGKEDRRSDRESSQDWAVSLKGRPHPGAGRGARDPLPMLSGGTAPRQPQGSGCLLFCSLSGRNLKGR